MQVTAIPAFRDNYVWAVHDERHAVLVDPGEAAPILAWLGQTRLLPVAILVTHRHGDHIGGIAELLMQYPAIRVHAQADIAGRTHALAGGDELTIPELGLRFEVLATPGHTRDHLCYFGHGRLFSGDTLFSCGCGRLFEGTPLQMYRSLARIKTLPGDTLVHCAHEYTLANLDFALRADPANPALHARLAEARGLRERNLATLPVSLAQELATNPFLRSDLPALAAAASTYLGHPVAPGVDTFTILRGWKDDLG